MYIFTKVQVGCVKMTSTTMTGVTRFLLLSRPEWTQRGQLLQTRNRKGLCGKEGYLRSKTSIPSLLDSNSKLLGLSVSKNPEGKDGPCKATPIHEARKTGWTVDLGRAIGGLACCHFPVWCMILVSATHVPHYPVLQRH